MGTELRTLFNMLDCKGRHGLYGVSEKLKWIIVQSDKWAFFAT